MAKCLCCKMDNAFAEFEKHLSETSLRAVEGVWRQLCAAARIPTIEEFAPIGKGIAACKRDHGQPGAFGPWLDATTMKIEALRATGVKVRRIVSDSSSSFFAIELDNLTNSQLLSSFRE